MKNNLLIMLFMAAIFIGCQKDEDYDAPNSFSDVGWYFSDTAGNLATSIDDYITFSDLSQGVVSHEWSIESGSYYLKMPIQRNDSVFNDKIIGTGTTSEKTVSVLFRKSGLQPVRLYNTFNEKVTFRGVINDGQDRVFIDSEEIDGKWVIDTTFIVDVYDTIVPIIKVKHNGMFIDHTKPLDTIFVEAGDFVELFDESTIGRADTWEWTIGTAKSNDQNAQLVLKKLGIFKGTFRINRVGQNVPNDFEFYKIPINFKVIPSSQPFVVIPEDIKELENQTIQIPYNGEFAQFVNQEGFFTVKVNGTPFDIASLTINTDDETILDIKLVETIYRNDNITVSYDGNGTLESTDTRTPLAFTDLPVPMFQHEAVVFDFEDGDGSNWTAHPENLATTTIGLSTEQSASGGTYSLKVDAAASGTWSSFRNLVDQYSLKAGVQYQYDYKIYKLPGAVINMNGPWITKDGGETVTQFWNNVVKDAPANTWVTVSPNGRYTSSEAADYFEIYIRHNGMGVLYFDDIRILEVDQRP